ncbi:MAG TPA: DUF3793 family protein [Candidatus Fimousia stercorigallinarum]|nr:DUF3793 family protein [Candidatus Fimousia stercorigallinarum]
MPIELMKNYYRTTTADAYIHMTIALHCAPFLKGIKDSALLVLKPEDAQAMGMMLSRMNAKCKLMYRNCKKIILLLYREAKLRELLQDRQIRHFLKKYGYGKCGQLDEILNCLKSRFQSAYGKRQEFPHEIGAFLGYPLEDVEGFIENNGQNSLLTGYWKVYSDKERAQKLFRRYDEAREVAIHEVLEGKKFYEIAV